MRGFNTALEQGQHVVRQHRNGKAQQRGTWMTQGADLAVQDRLESLEHAFDTPALAIESGDLVCAHRGRQIAPEPDHRVAGLGGLVQLQFDAPPALQPRLQVNALLTYLPGLDARSFHPWPTAGKRRAVSAMFAHDEAGL